ncbi:MAG TPA: tetratricopeptide repeat protein [Drouetiella sp.]
MTRSKLLEFSLLCSLMALSTGCAAHAQMSAMERGEAALVHHDYDGAIESYTEALGFNMNNTAAYFKRGQCYYYLKKYTEALSDFEYMLKASPTDTQALLWSGTAEAKLGQDQKAFDYYMRAIRSQPALAADFVKKQGNLKSQAVNPKNEGAVSAYEKAIAQYVTEHPELGTINSAASGSKPSDGGSPKE